MKKPGGGTPGENTSTSGRASKCVVATEAQNRARKLEVFAPTVPVKRRQRMRVVLRITLAIVMISCVILAFAIGFRMGHAKGSGERALKAYEKLLHSIERRRRHE